MSYRAPDWYALNATRPYPVDDAADCTDDSGAHLPHDVVVDLNFQYDAPTPGRALLAGLTSTDRLLTAVLVYAPTGPVGGGATTPPSHWLLGSVSVPQPVEPGRPYPITGANAGAAGWVVFGPGARRPGRWRFSTAAQAGLTPRAARSIPRAGVTSLQIPGGTPLTGIVRLEPGNDVALAVETVRVHDAPVTAIVVRLADDDRGDDPLHAYAGPCGGRPAEGTCREPALESLNGVPPDCLGVLSIQLHGGYARQLAGGHGFAIDYPVGIDAACAGAREPTWLNVDCRDDLPISSEQLGTFYAESSYALFRGWAATGLPYVATLADGVPAPLLLEVGRLAHRPAPGVAVPGLGAPGGWLEARDGSRRLVARFDVVREDPPGTFVPATVVNARVIVDGGGIPDDPGFRNLGVILDLHEAPYPAAPPVAGESQALRRYLAVLANHRDSSFDLWWFDGVGFRRLTDPNLIGLCPLSASTTYRVTADLVLADPHGPATVVATLEDLGTATVVASFSLPTVKISALLYPDWPQPVVARNGLGAIRSRTRFHRFTWQEL